MANPELELISSIVARGDFASARRLGLGPGHFQTVEGKDVFQWLWNEYHDPNHLGEVPDEVRLKRHWPNFPFVAGRNSIEALVHDVMSNQVRVEINQLTSEMQELVDEGEDPALVLAAYLPRFRDLNATGTRNDGLLFAHSGAHLRAEYETKQAAGGITGIPYLWAPLNDATCGMQPEEFIVLYGRPKNGKSWLALALAVNAYAANRRVLVYSKEMSKEAMLRRSASIFAQVDYDQLRKAKLSPARQTDFFELLDELSHFEEMDAKGGQRRSMLFVGDVGRQGGTVDTLAAQAEKFEDDLVIADGFYLMRDGRTNTRGADWRQIAHISQDLKGLAQQQKISVLGTTQANRAANKTHGDDLDELSFADNISQDADLVMRCFRGKAPDGKGAALFTFPGVRETEVLPFSINFRPGHDFSLLDDKVDVASFLKSAKSLSEEDGGPAQASGKPSTSPKSSKRKPLPFRA